MRIQLPTRRYRTNSRNKTVTLRLSKQRISMNNKKHTHHHSCYHYWRAENTKNHHAGQEETGTRADLIQSSGVFMVPEMLADPCQFKWTPFAVSSPVTTPTVNVNIQRSIRVTENLTWCANCLGNYSVRYLGCPCLQGSREAKKIAIKLPYKEAWWQYEATICLTKTDLRSAKGPVI